MSVHYVIICRDDHGKLFSPETAYPLSSREATDDVRSGEHMFPVAKVLRLSGDDVVDETQAFAEAIAQTSFAVRHHPGRYAEEFCSRFGFEVYNDRDDARRDPNDEHRLSAVQLGVGGR